MYKKLGMAALAGAALYGGLSGRPNRLAADRWNYDDPRFQDRLDKALFASMDLQEKWPSTPAREYVEYQRRGKKHPNHVAYGKAHAKLWAKYLRGTGWTEDEVDREIENRFDAAVYTPLNQRE